MTWDQLDTDLRRFRRIRTGRGRIRTWLRGLTRDPLNRWGYR